MKFEDEYRPASAATAAHRARIVADLDGFIREHDDLIHRDKRNAIEVAAFQKQVDELQEEVAKLRRDQARRNAEVSRLTAENTKLLRVLTALRNSWRVKVGTSVTAPLRWAGGAVKTLNKVVLTGTDTQPQKQLTGPVAKGVASSPTAVRAEDTPRKWSELLKAVAANPTKANVLDAASFGYYTLGMITKPLEMLREHSEVLSPFVGKEKQLVRTLEGLAAVREKNFSLTPRQTNSTFQAERGRLLYCAHSVAPYNSNGYSTRTAGLVEGMYSSGLDIAVAARPGYPWDVATDIAVEAPLSFETSFNGISHFFSSGPSWSEDRLDHYLEKAVDSYVQVALRTRPEMMQAASNHVTALPALIAARRLGLPFVYEVRGLWEITKASTSPHWADSEAFDLAKKLETLVATAADHVFAITDQVRDELISRGVSPENISVLSNAVNTRAFSPMPAHEPTRQTLGLSSDTPVIGYAGSLVEYEGLETLLEASRLLADQGVDFRTVIVGDGASLQRLRDKTKQLDLGNKVTFTGRVSPADISNFISVFDILPCPRLPLQVTEMVSPLKPLEAMAAGKAVVLSDLAPLKDIAGADGLRARLFQAGNAADLAAVLTELLNDPDQRREMGRRARLWTVGERDWMQIGATAKTALSNPRQWRSSEETEAAPRELSEITVGIIADPFTFAGLEPEAALVKLRPETWAQQLAEKPVDVLFVESAWEGNDGTWQGKVGFYNDDLFSALRGLIAYCRNRSIPTVFWNKEDPVHFNRFRITAKHFDHVFTSDEASVQAYLDNAGANLKSVSSLPFYAQPALHNPIAGRRTYSHTVAYAGSYYGDRYKKRSDQLQKLLAAAIPSGLSVYDRQHLNPESPYKFPAELARYVRGGLSYKETIDAYKAHPVHINVNSVENSGTMFSRRVYEIAACGGVLLSGPGLGIQKMFGGIIPIADDQSNASALIDYWMRNEVARKADAWLALRAVYRSHTAGHRLAYVLRTAGLRVNAPQLDPYVVVAERLNEKNIADLEGQSVRPALVIVSEPLAEGLKTELCVRVSAEPEAAVVASGHDLVGTIPEDTMDRTFFEDLLTTRKYSKWKNASYAVPPATANRGSLVRVAAADECCRGGALYSVSGSGEGPVILLSRDIGSTAAHVRGVGELSTVADMRATSGTKTVLVAGHDLKFAQGIIAQLESQGHVVLIDQWRGHSEHDEDRSRALLAQADIVFCEWTLGNAVWYSRHKLPGQRLVTRLHLQEISTKYLAQVRKAEVDLYVFVGQHIADIAQRDFGIPDARSRVVPNYVPAALLRKPKTHDARWNVGIVGSVPQRKRLDLALDALRLLRQEDDRYTLHIKGKRAQDYPWMKDRPEELGFYEEQDDRIRTDPLLSGAVFFDGHGDDMDAWYQKIGTVLSVSDFESFHLTLADGAASGAVPVALAWDGADRIYPVEWLHPSLPELVRSVLSTTADTERWRVAGDSAARYAEDTFDQIHVLPLLTSLILGSDREGPRIE